VAIESLAKHGFWAHNWYWYTFVLMNVRETFAPVGVLRNLWSLAVEEHFYLIWPTVFYLLGRKRAAQVLVAILIISPILRLAFTPIFKSYIPIYFLTPFRLDGLAAGALAAILVRQGRLNLSPRPLALGLAACGPIAYLSVHFIPGFYREANSLLFNSIGYSLITLVACAFVLLAYSTRSPAFGKALTFGPLVYMGTISYFVYLFHSAIIHYVPLHVPAEKAAAGVGITILAATCSWYFYERPILKTKFWERPRQRAAESVEPLGQSLR
jgi:peptidoglycan/LPS O-acetylase OafA/YrhL